MQHTEEHIVLKAFLLLIVAVVAALTSTTQGQALVPTLKKVAAFGLPGPPGKRFDYLTIDPDDRYLISAHLAAGRQTYIIDLRTKRLLRRSQTHQELKVWSTYRS